MRGCAHPSRVSSAAEETATASEAATERTAAAAPQLGTLSLVSHALVASSCSLRMRHETPSPLSHIAVSSAIPAASEAASDSDTAAFDHIGTSSDLSHFCFSTISSKKK